MSSNSGKTFFAKHAKSSAALISLIVHAILLIIATTYVMVTVIPKNEAEFEAKKIKRPKMELKKLKVPVKVERRKKPAAKLKTTFVTKTTRKVPEFVMPEVSGVKGGIGAMDLSEGSMEIGFTLPEIDFFGAKAKGEKIVFVVHFGPATINDGQKGGTPFSRMTGLTIRHRLDELVGSLPEYALFNVVTYFAGDCWAMEPKMQPATAANKQKVKDWMAPVNPLEGQYEHCFADTRKLTEAAYKNYPTRVEGLPFYATKWCFPYYVPNELEKKYAPDAPGGYMHWGRGIVWALLEQKPDTIFVLTTNYIDGWSDRGTGSPNQPDKMAKSLEKICMDVYGSDRKKWPTINIVVLAKAGRDSEGASNVLGTFKPIVSAFKGDGSIIEDITDFMNNEEKKLYKEYQAVYGR